MTQYVHLVQIFEMEQQHAAMRPPCSQTGVTLEFEIKMGM